MMDLILGIWNYVIPFLFILTILVFVHELGHFWAGRYCGVKVEVFSIGFGPELFGFNDKKGTRWKFSLLPFGGYVKFFGDADGMSRPDGSIAKMSKSEKELSMHHKNVWQRILISAAGPLANYIFAVLLFAALFATVGQKILRPEIGDVAPQSAAQSAGLQKGDLVTFAAGQKVERFEELQKIIQEHPAQALPLKIMRANQEKEIIVTPSVREVTDRFGTTHKTGVLGVVRPSSFEYEKHGVVSAFGVAVKQTFLVSKEMLIGIGQIIMGSRSAEELGGPLRIAQISGQVFQMGFVALLMLMCLISINLGLINLFPLPGLDGGHLLFYFIEAIVGKPLPEKAQDYAFRFGFFVLIALMLFSTWNDLVQLKVVLFVRQLFGG